MGGEGNCKEVLGPDRFPFQNSIKEGFFHVQKNTRMLEELYSREETIARGVGTAADNSVALDVWTSWNDGNFL